MQCICDECGGQTRVIDSYPTSDAVIRQRECKTCGKRFITIEIVSYDDDDRFMLFNHHHVRRRYARRRR